MKSRAVTEARSHFSLLRTSSSICCEDRRRRSGGTGAQETHPVRFHPAGCLSRGHLKAPSRCHCNSPPLEGDRRVEELSHFLTLHNFWVKLCVDAPPPRSEAP